MTEFLVRGEVKRGVRKTTTMELQRAHFGLFRMLAERVTWERVLKGKGVQEGWTFFKEEVLKAQEHVVSMCCKMNRRGRQLLCLNREILLGLRKEMRGYHFWNKGQATQEDTGVTLGRAERKAERQKRS